MRRFLRYTAKALAIILSVFVLSCIIAFIYISVNKKSIIKNVTDELGKKINGNVSIGNVELSFFSNFPKATVILHNVLITDTMFARHHHLFFKADEVHALLSVIRVIEKKSALNGIRIEGASLYLFTDTAGYTNAYLLKPKSSQAGSGNKTTQEPLQLKSAELKDVRITIDDMLREKLLDGIVNSLKLKLDDQENTTYFSSKANILVNSLAFRLSNGSFIKGKKFEGDFKIRFDKKLQQLQFDSIDIEIDHQRFNMTGRFDLVKPDPQFSLRVHTRQIFYDFGKSLLPAKTDSALSIVTMDQKLDADADISGPLKGEDPLIFVKWNVTHSKLKTPLLNFDNASFTGYYTNEVVIGKPRRDPNSKISTSNFTAIWNGFPVSSSHIEILNLFQPVVTCDLTSAFPLTKLNELIGSNYIQLQAGDGLIDITYKGPLEKNNNTNSFVNGKVTFKQGKILYTPRNVDLKNINGLLEFKNSDVSIENLQCDVLNNKFIMNGEAKNLITLLTTEPNKAVIDWNIYSPSLNMASFLYLLKPKSKVTDIRNASKPKLDKLSSSIDDVLEKGILNVTLKTPNLIYKKFEASDFIANVTLLDDQYRINNVSMNHAGGHINLKGWLVSNKENYHTAKINASLDNVDVNKIFSAFNNFGQSGISAENIEGKLTATVNADFVLNDEGQTYPNSVESIVKFSLKNGALNNFEPVKKIESFVFKNRNFDSIRFAELKDSLKIKNQEIKINRMEIQSNVFSIYVEGVYSMKGNTDMSIQVPLSNLKKRGADYKPVNEGMDKKAGPSLYLRGRPGSDGTIQFKPDLLHIFRKPKDK